MSIEKNKSNMRYDYEFAGMHILIESPFEIEIGRESAPFMKMVGEDCAKKTVSYIMKIEACENDEELMVGSSGKWFETRCFVAGQDDLPEKVYYCSVKGNQKAYAVVYFEDDSNYRVIRCTYDLDRIKSVNLSRNICEFLQFETILKQVHGIWLHASHIRWQNKGILFSGPSGIGKSTQANLWINCEQAELLNGDKTALRKTENGWMGYGLPYAGSSEIFRNEQSEIAAIVCLGQGPENTIRRMRPMEAFRFLYSQTSIHYWDAHFINVVSDILMDVIQEVPVYYLECLPDEGAVELLKSIL